MHRPERDLRVVRDGGQPWAERLNPFGIPMINIRKMSNLNPGSSTWYVSSTLAVALTLCAGCYDGSAMVKQAQSTALNSRLAEIDLGKLQTTLPRDPNTNHFTALDIHIFGTVPRYKLAAITRQLKADEYRFRYETLIAVRKSTRGELAEPNFAKLRARIEKVVNELLADAPVKEIGFYQLTMRSP